jgi:glycosyltransferase involved in cell wall biosynthesis
VTPAVSVIVPTFNRAEVLTRTLPCLLEQDLGDDRYEVVLVDDGSTDGTRDVASASACPALRYHRFDHVGRAAVRNHALRVARGAVLVFVDDDAFVPPGFLAAHLAGHAGRDDRIVTGPIVMVPDRPERLRVTPPWRGFHRNPFPTVNVSVLREHVLAAGGFDERFRLYGWEDVELGTRLERRGLRRRFVRAAPVFHWKPGDPGLRLAADLALERERGTMGARFYRKERSVRVGLITKMWWPFRAADAGLAWLAPLDRLAARVEARPELGARLPAFVRVLLRFHAEISAGRLELGRECS